MYSIALLMTISGLWRLGGWDKAHWSGYRDVLVPALLAIWFKNPYLFATYSTIRLGYGAYDPEHDDKPSHLAMLTHDREGWIIRGIHGLIRASVGAFPLFIIGTVSGEKYLYYIFLNVILSAVLCKFRAKDIIIEPLEGLTTGSIITFV